MCSLQWWLFVQCHVERSIPLSGSALLQWVFPTTVVSIFFSVTNTLSLCWFLFIFSCTACTQGLQMCRDWDPMIPQSLRSSEHVRNEVERGTEVKDKLLCMCLLCAWFYHLSDPWHYGPLNWPIVTVLLFSVTISCKNCIYISEEINYNPRL